MANLVITIDGPAASGKSTIARLLAKKLSACFLDTGAMYRAVTLAAIESGIDMTDEEKLTRVLEETDFEFKTEDEKMIVYVNGAEVTEKIRAAEVTADVHYVACSPKIRTKLVQMQRDFAATRDKIVTEGRDQGTVAFPDARIKFFLTADIGERARRRVAELTEKGQRYSLEQIQQAIEQRDKTDLNRTVGPLKPAEDAVVVDTTALSINQVVEKLIAHIEKNVPK